MDISQQQLRKEQILNAALAVIVQNGYEKSRMDDIVQVSNLSKGAIYWYYKSKKDVYLSLINLWVNRYSAVLNHMTEEEKPASQQLQDLFQYFINQYENDPDVFRALLEFWSMAGRDSDFKDKLNQVYNEFLDLIRGIIAKGVKSGEFKSLDIDIAALSIMVNIEGIIWFTIFEAGNIDARNYINTISDFILAGLITTQSGESNGQPSH